MLRNLMARLSGWITRLFGRPVVEGPFDHLPTPPPLRRGLAVRYRWGPHDFDIIVSACAVRALPWPDTGEELAWLHCKAVESRAIRSDGQAQLLTVLIPARYVTRAEPGPTYRMTRSQPGDLGIFPPIHDSPPDALPLDELERIIARLQGEGDPGMTRKAPLPLAQSFLVCKEIFQDRHSGLYMLHGPFHTVTLPAFPAALRLSLYIQLTGAHGTYRLGLEMRDAEGNSLSRAQAGELARLDDPVS